MDSWHSRGALAHIDNTNTVDVTPSSVSSAYGNTFIKHTDKWRGDYYLREDLTFTVDRSQACKFYLLKPGDTTILNGDRIGIHVGSRTLVVDPTGHLRLVDREQLISRSREISTFVITNGSDNTDPITYESSVFFISDKNNGSALKYDWSMNLSLASAYRPHDHPTLINGNYNTSESSFNSFQFALERSDSPITRAIAISSPSSHRPKSSELLDGYKGAVMIVLLMVILVLSVLASKY